MSRERQAGVEGADTRVTSSVQAKEQGVPSHGL